MSILFCLIIDWRGFKLNSIDVVISGKPSSTPNFSGNMFESRACSSRTDFVHHCTIQSEHPFPIDCWRFYPDGLRPMARPSMSRAGTQMDDLAQSIRKVQWHESMLIARKATRGIWDQVAAKLRSR